MTKRWIVFGVAALLVLFVGVFVAGAGLLGLAGLALVPVTVETSGPDLAPTPEISVEAGMAGSAMPVPGLEGVDEMIVTQE